MKTIPHKFLQGITTGKLDLIEDEDLTTTVMDAMDAAIEMKNIAYATGFMAAVQQVQRDLASALTQRSAS